MAEKGTAKFSNLFQTDRKMAKKKKRSFFNSARSIVQKYNANILLCSSILTSDLPFAMYSVGISERAGECPSSHRPPTVLNIIYASKVFS